MNNTVNELTNGVNDAGVKPEDLEVLSYIYDNIDEYLSYSVIAENTGFTKAGIKKPIERLEEADLLQVDRSATPFLYMKTTAGEIVLESPSLSVNTVNDSGKAPSDSINTNVHDLAYEIPFSEDCIISRKNTETVLQKFGDKLSYDKENEQYYTDWDRFHIRLSGNKAVVYQREEENGFNATYVKNKAIKDLERCREFLEDELNLRFEDWRVVQGRVISQDVAVEDHPLVQAAEQSDLEVTPENFHTTDEEGSVRLKLDKSHGENGEMEASMRGKFSSDKRMEEEDIQFVLDDYGWMVQNKDLVRFQRQLLEKMKEKEIELEDLLDSIDESEDSCVKEEKRQEDKGLTLEDVEGKAELESISLETEQRDKVIFSESKENKEPEESEKHDVEPCYFCGTDCEATKREEMKEINCQNCDSEYFAPA